ncbi:MAG: hypothetical protein KY391_03185 [Actinobacteria bacterium]|nr:hypothetical protein [Actinomycetota bacterium]
MRKVLGLIAAFSLLAGGTTQAAVVTPEKATEGCFASNPAQSTCTYKVTHDNDSPVAGIGGVGSWVVTVKIGKKTTTVKSPSTGEPTSASVDLPKGAKVTAKALSPGSTLIVGHAD